MTTLARPARRLSSWLPVGGGLLALALIGAPICGRAEMTPPARPAAAAAVDEPKVGAAELITYGWRLEGFLGSLASLFFPSSGIASLTTRQLPTGELETVLHITVPRNQREHWTYGSVLAPDGTPRRAWSSYTFRGDSKQKEIEVRERGVRDVASAIYHLRRDPPRVTTAMTIWSEGKVYPVEVVPRGPVTVELPGGPVRTRRLTVRGVERPGQRLWKGQLELWLAEDAAATPVVISVERSSARVRLERDERVIEALAAR